MYWSWPAESRQSSPNNTSKHQLKVLCAVSRGSEFSTLQILSFFVASGTSEGSEPESVVISLTSVLIAVTVGIELRGF
jgi:hypothetical protein